VNKIIARFRYALNSEKLQDALLQEDLRRLDERTAKAKAKAAMAEAVAEAEARGETRGVAKGKAEGKAEGAAESRVQDILAVLDHRGVTLTRAQRKRILRCTSLATLDAWFRRALTVTDAASLFATPPENDLATKPAA
jgi:predicted transposase YdaD